MIVQWSKRWRNEPNGNRSAIDGCRRAYPSETTRCLRQSCPTDILQSDRVSTERVQSER